VSELLRGAVLGFAALFVALGLALFVPAGTFDYWQAWLYLAVFAVSAGLITVYLWRNNRDLLARRVRAGPGAETTRSQQVIQGLAALAFVGMFVVSGLDHRFGWSSVAVPIVLLADVLVAVGFYVVFLVFKENTFAAAIIDVAEEQQVISTGPYAVVRHPMYAGAALLIFGTPPALGSWWGPIFSVVLMLVIVWRLLDEEQFLAKNLPGYAEYRQRVRHRLLPRVW